MSKTIAIASAPRPAARPALSPLPLTYERAGYADSTTRALDRLTAMQNAKNSLAVKISVITLIPSIILSGLIGTSIVLAHW